MTGDFAPLGKMLILAGGLVVLVGVILVFADKLPFVGRLPGDFHFKKDGFSFYFPLATSILLSLVISLLFWLFRR